MMLLLSACSEDELFLMHCEFIDENGAETYMGGSCQTVQDEDDHGSVTSTAGEVRYILEHVWLDGGVLLRIRTPDAVALAQKAYSREFLLSGEKDVVPVQLVPDVRLRVQSWGGGTCESPPEPEVRDS